jgi:hypothetical protein
VSIELDEVLSGCDEMSSEETDKLEEIGDFETVFGGEVDGASRSRKSGSCPTTSARPVSLSLAPELPISSRGGDLRKPGSVGSRRGEVIRSSGTSPSVSKTKKASPASPIFILNGTAFPLTAMSTFFSLGRSTCHFPNRTWNGVLKSSAVPSNPSLRTTMTSIAPVSVDGLMSL